MASRPSIDLLRNVRMFSALPEPILKGVLECCELTTVRAGALALKAGELPAQLSLVVSGQMRVVDDRSDRASVIDVLGAGAAFGESLLDGTAATFSVYCTADAEILQLPRGRFEDLQQREPEIEIAIRDYLATRDRLEDDEADAPWAGEPADTARDDQGDLGGGSKHAPAAGELPWPKADWMPPARVARWRRPLVVQEREADAGPACLATVARLCGRRIGVARLREPAGATRGPATPAGLARAAESLGFVTFAVHATWEHLAANHLPAIAAVDATHWVVVYQVADDRVVVGDPARGRAPMTRSEFERRWSGVTLYLRPTDRFAEVEESRRPLARVAVYARPLRLLIAELIVASVVIQLLSLLFPILARFVIDDVIARADARWLPAALGAIAVVLVAYLVTSFSRRYLLDFVSRQVDGRLLADFHRHLLSLPVRFFESRHVGDIVGRFEEAGRITQLLAETGVGLFIDVLTAALSVALMAHYSGRLTLVALVALVAEVITLSFVTPRLEKGFRELSERELDSDGRLIEALSGLKTIKVLAIEHFIRWRLRDGLARVVNASLGTVPSRTFAALANDLASQIGTLAVLFYGTSMVLAGQLSVGGLVAFGILTRGLIAPFAQLVAAWDRMQAAVRSVEQLNEVFEQPPEARERATNDQVVLHKLQGHVRFEGVSFRYERDSADVLRDVTFECYGGQRVVILGRSGSGKSTLIKLLFGLYTPSAGTVSIDGFDLGSIWAPSLRRQLGIVLQEPALFSGTIRSNISHTMPAAPLGEVVKAATLVNAHRFISALPQGYEAPVEEHGANLSGGQRQQIAIARAFLHGPRMLVFDEATSNLDNESERVFEQNVAAAFKDCTVVTITQRLAAARHADLILVLDRGAIVEQGSHDELVACEGLYHRFTQEQTL